MALAAIWLLTGVNLRGVRDAGRVQNVTTLLKILPLVAVGIGGLFVFNASHFEFADSGGRAMLRVRPRPRR